MVSRDCWLLKFACLVTCAGLVTILGVVGAAKFTYPQDYPDPFIPYEVVIFRQSVEDDLCDAQWQDKFTHQSTCKIEPKSGPFNEINILRCECDPPTFEIAFWSRRLQVADLVRRWGRPDHITIVHNGNHYMLQWDEERLEAYIPRGERFTYQVNVQLVRWHG